MSAWCSPIVLMQKKDRAIQFCVDYWKVNEMSQFYSYPMPGQQAPPPARYCSFFHDAGYNQRLLIDSLVTESNEKIAFSTLYSLYQCIILVFSLFKLGAASVYCIYGYLPG